VLDTVRVSVHNRGCYWERPAGGSRRMVLKEDRGGEGPCFVEAGIRSPARNNHRTPQAWPFGIWGC
jgi:hypothetical protein